MGYNQIDSALQDYSLACSEQITPSFKGDKELIEKIIKVIASKNSEKPFREQFDFAYKLYINMEIESRSDEDSFLNDLSVLLANPVITENFASFKDIYLLFENKRIVKGILDSIIKNNYGENQIKLLIYYLKQARKYYADERTFYSDFISILGEDITKDTVKNHLLEAKMNTGIYGDEVIVALHGEVASLISQLSELKEKREQLMLENEEIRKSNEELKRDYKELLEDIEKILQEEPEKEPVKKRV